MDDSGTDSDRNAPILTPDRRIRVFVSSTLRELAAERRAARAAIEGLHFTPVMFELGARPHPPQSLYRAYLEQSDVFVGIYGRSYGWVAPDMEVSGLEDEYALAADMPKLVYVKDAGADREPRLHELLRRIAGGPVSYRYFEHEEELGTLLADDLALLASERFTWVASAVPPLAPLPAPVSSFVGRERELEDARQLLERDDVRLLTLTGPGGIGKTRLGLEAGRSVANRFEDGVAFVPLATVSTAEDVAPTLAEALGIRTQTGTSLPDAIAARLANLHLLLVLDNLEHVVSAAAPLIGRLLESAPGLNVLATSRVRLDIGGEHVYRVPPLGLPDDGESGVEAIRRSDAVRLFAARAEGAGWTAADADAPLLSDIVRRLDGLPLAIELAAAQTRLVPAEVVHFRLRTRLDLGGGPRDAEERHRTLRSAIGWSYDLLDATARHVFDQLAVFVGGFSLDAAAAVVGPTDDVENVLASLVDASLLATASAPESGVRLGMLETVRDYAEERLRERGEYATVAARHLAFFAQLADEAYEASPERRPIMRLRLDEEHQNLRAALEEATRTNPIQAVRLVGALSGHFGRRGVAGAGREIIAHALAAAPTAPAKWRARALVHGAWLAAEHDECGEADRLASEALRLFRSLGDHRGIGSSLNTLGYSAATRGDDEAAISFYEQSYEAFAAADHDWRLYPAANLATVLLASRTDLDRSRQLLEEALEYFDASGFEDEAATARLRMAELEESLGELAAARGEGETAAAACRRIGNRQLLAWVLVRLAHIDAASGLLERAAESYEEAFDIHLEEGQRSGVAYSVECIARLALDTDRADAAARLLGSARVIRDQLGVPMPLQDRLEAQETDERLREVLRVADYERESQAGAALTETELASLVHDVLGIHAYSR